jgi:hypothetical protein
LLGSKSSQLFLVLSFLFLFHHFFTTILHYFFLLQLYFCIFHHNSSLWLQFLLHFFVIIFLQIFQFFEFKPTSFQKTRVLRFPSVFQSMFIIFILSMPHLSGQNYTHSTISSSITETVMGSILGVFIIIHFCFQ